MSSIINSENLIVVGTSLANNDIANRRRENLFNEMNKYKIPVIFNYGIINERNYEEAARIIFNNNMNMFQKTNFEYGIIIDDDFHPHANFLEELNKTVELLPKNWRSLHLCPGYLWGRMYRKANTAGDMDPEGDLTGLDYHESGRFFINCKGSIWHDKHFIFLGGPIAILINRKNVDSMLCNFDELYKNHREPSDRILTKTLGENDYVCRNPQLGIEKEQGGTTFTYGPTP
jgi:hypothetical protein